MISKCKLQFYYFTGKFHLIYTNETGWVPLFSLSPFSDARFTTQTAKHAFFVLLKVFFTVYKLLHVLKNYKSFFEFGAFFKRLFLFRERDGKEKERNIDVRENINHLPLSWAPTGDRTCNPGMCPDWNRTFCFAGRRPAN